MYNLRLKHSYINKWNRQASLLYTNSGVYSTPIHVCSIILPCDDVPFTITLIHISLNFIVKFSDIS